MLPAVRTVFTKQGYKISPKAGGGNYTWSHLWFEGDWESIFESNAFQSNQIFWDDPWCIPEFYKYLKHRIPSAQFLYISFPPDRWISRYVNLGCGRSDGLSKVHAKIFNRGLDYFWMKDNIEGFEKNGIRQFVVADMVTHYLNEFNRLDLIAKEFIDTLPPKSGHILKVGKTNPGDLQALELWLNK